MPFPKLATRKFIPNLGDLHVIGADGLGICAVDATIALNTVQTDAQLIAGAPNTGLVNACGPIVHSLGIPPSVSFLLARGTVNSVTGGPIFAYMTANNSAVFFRAQSFTGVIPAGVAVRMIAIP